MSQARRHVIRRECIDLAVEGGESEGFALHERVAALCEGALAAALDEAFARAAPGDEHWRFERIEIDAGCFTAESFERDFVAAVAAAVEEQVRVRKAQVVAQPAIAAGEGDTQWSGAQSIHEAWLYFLATGALPWWCHLPEGRTLESMVSAAWDAAEVADTPRGESPGQGRAVGSLPLRPALLRVLASPVARLRLARQFSREFLERLLGRLAPEALVVLRDIVQAIRRTVAAAIPADAIPEQAWVAVFACIATQRTITPKELLQAWAALSPELVTPAMIESVVGPAATHDETPPLEHHGADTTAKERHVMTSNKTPTHEDTANAAAAPLIEGRLAPPRVAAPAKTLDLQEAFFVDCAGVVLLHPFLPKLFERRGIWVNQQLVDPDRALALLHFLATGQTSAPEHALVLPKLLCGLEPSALAGAPVDLSEEDRSDVEAMMQAAIGYWSALGDTSYDGFRGNFLVRAGRLSKRGDDDLLQVEKRSWDILLNQLPWGIGVVRLPWMQRMLWVEWPY